MAVYLVQEYIRIVAEVSAVEEDGIELGVSSRPRSSWMFFGMKSPSRAILVLLKLRPKTMTARTGLAFCDDHAAAVEHLFQLLQVEVSLSVPGGRARRYDRLLDGQLDYERLRIKEGK